MSNSGFELGLDDPANAGVFAVTDGDLPALAAAARDVGLRICRVDLEGCHDKRTLLARLAAQLDFPAGFGGNWDALSDNLTDLSWLPADGYALLFSDADDFYHAAMADFSTLLDILEDASRAWAEHGVPFWAFLEMDDVEHDPSAGNA